MAILAASGTRELYPPQIMAGARLVESTWRPVPLREGVYCNGAVIFNDGTVKWTERPTGLDAVNLALETIREGGQALVFVNTRKGSEALARNASAEVARLIPEGEREGLARLAAEISGEGAESTRLDRRLAECVAGGSAFHHAGIDASRRRLIEDAFRRNRLRLLAATTTLAMGLNLPSRRVVIRDWWRFEPGEGLVPLPVMEVKQMAGRAGRPGLDPFGEAVLIARDRRDERRLFADYINGKVEEVTSRLAGEASLRSHLLASIAAGFTPTRPALDAFLGATFCAHQAGRESLVRLSGEIVSFLEREEMAVVSGERLAVTPFGRRSAELYIDPLTAVSLRDSLRRAPAPETLPLLHMLARTPDMMVLQLRKRDIDEFLPLFHRHCNALLISEEERQPTEEVLAELKTAACLLDWIEETPEDEIVGRFAIGPGDLHTLVQLGDWLLYASGQVAKIFALTAAERAVASLRTRVLYGVKEELLELVTLHGVGRVRARSLFAAGYRGVAELKGASAAELARLPAIGERVAAEILAQVEALSAEGMAQRKGRRRR